MNKTTSKGAKQGHHGVPAHGQFSVYNTAAACMAIICLNKIIHNLFHRLPSAERYIACYESQSPLAHQLSHAPQNGAPASSPVAAWV